MFSDGYVGTSEDVARIRRQEKQREEQKKKFEALAKESKARADGAGLRQFGASSEEVGARVAVPAVPSRPPRRRQARLVQRAVPSSAAPCA